MESCRSIWRAVRNHAHIHIDRHRISSIIRSISNWPSSWTKFNWRCFTVFVPNCRCATAESSVRLGSTLNPEGMSCASRKWSKPPCFSHPEAGQSIWWNRHSGTGSRDRHGPPAENYNCPDPSCLWRLDTRYKKIWLALPGCHCIWYANIQRSCSFLEVYSENITV